jgi:sulfate permease, SulP family
METLQSLRIPGWGVPDDGGESATGNFGRPGGRLTATREAPTTADAGAPAGRLVALATAGIVLGVIEVVLATSFATLIFAGDLSVHLPAAIGLALVAAAVILPVTALLSTVRGTVASVQDVSAAILALVAAAIAARIGAESPEAFLTVVLAISLTTVLAGAFFVALGSLRLGNLIRFVPYPVVGGFLGGTGWLLVQGSFAVLSDVPLTPSTIPDLLEAGTVARWVPGVVFAVVLLALVRRYGHFLIIPVGLVVAMGGFYGVLAIGGSSVAAAQDGGWLLGPFPAGNLWEPHVARAVTGADWSAVVAELGNVAIVMLFAALGLLLNAGGIELAVRRDVNLDRELRAAGVANIAAGLTGGIPGYQALSLTSLAHQMKATGRIVGCIAGAVCLATLIVGAETLSLFPRMAIGGLLLLVGLSFIVDWVFDTWSKLPRTEYAVLLGIVVIIGVWGFVQGVLVGLAAAIVLFLVAYSRLDVVKHTLSGRTYRSKVDRPEDHCAVLRERGGQLHILELEGFLFFGTANSLFERIHARVHDPDQPSLRFLVIDFRRVTGLDSSAALSFAKARSLADTESFALVLTGLTDRVRQVLAQGGVTAAPDAALQEFPDLDRGVQWCEEQLLTDVLNTAAGPPDSVSGWIGGRDGAALRGYLESLTIPAGHVLIRQGEESDGLYFVESGQLTVQLTADHGPPARLRTLGAGAVVGELTMYLQVPRTATVVSDTPCVVYRLSAAALEGMERSNPELVARLHQRLAEVLAGRLADTLGTVQALLD